ncbi:response regulator transcription factor [Saccharopolyspora sp. WRP15-2]|uniref:Response regulator transcription factor n=1 Tax=Saccharopolyspora oryzae TaxID=2997343 RepID=A0ABT4V6G2_9PSEU|nr:response regulator transcription factor [Saccharopolyspora oryzae]MDA3629555.1 response regulator transcription factor [Saccharopolyspora oryzae]
MINLIIVADTRFHREGLALALRCAGPRIDAITALARPEELDATATGRSGSVLLLDVTNTCDGPGTVTALRCRHPHLRIVALGVPACEAEIVAYAEAGAVGYLTRDSSIAELVCTIESVARGEMRCTPRVAAALGRRVAELADELRPAGAGESLSRREAEVAVLLELGLSNQQISRRLCIALATVKNHVHNILTKLEVPTRAEVAEWAWRQELHRSVVVRQLPEMATSDHSGGTCRRTGESPPHGNDRAIPDQRRLSRIALGSTRAAPRESASTP